MRSRVPLSPIVELWAAVFQRLRVISTLWIPRGILRHTPDDTIKEIWASIPPVFALALLIAVPTHVPSFLKWPLIVIIIIRVLELLVIQVNVLLFDQYRDELAGREWAPVSPYRLVVLLVQNVVEIALWFALAFKLSQPWYEGLPPDSPLNAFSLSFSNMTSFGTYPVQALCLSAQAALTAQAAIGAFLTLAVLARFLSLLPPASHRNDRSA